MSTAAASSATTSSSDTTCGSDRFKIYTRTGDKGNASLYTGERRPKDDVVFEALGAVDELNANIGVARELCEEADNGLIAPLELIQSALLDIGSVIATPRSSSTEARLARVKFDADLVDEIEEWIDTLDAHLPPLRNFILPSGGRASSFLHVARVVCRRAERRVTPLVRAGEIDDVVQRYLNRLSDYLFTAARYAAFKDKKPEIIYRKGQFKKDNSTPAPAADPPT